MNIILYTAPKSLTNDTNFSNYLLIVDAYSKTPKIYGMENITTAEVMDKLDMLQSRFGEIDQFGSMNTKARSKIPLKPKAPFKWVFINIIPSTAPKSLTNDKKFLIIC